MMIKECLSKISILLICSFSLLSYNSNNFNRKLLDNYTIEKSELISDAKISRISNIVNIKTISKFSTKYDWTYDTAALFFQPEYCTMSRNELGAFLKWVQPGDFEFENDRYSCTGTPFYSYNSKKKIDPVEVSIDAKDIETDDSLEKNYAFFYITDLREYKLTSKTDNSTFSLYVSFNSLIVSFEPA